MSALLNPTFERKLPGLRAHIGGSPEGLSNHVHAGNRGAALIIVLSCLVLVVVVVVAFMAASVTERGASHSFAEGGRARLLAQSAMDIVQGQIWAATTQEDTSWASQPGAIRTFAPGNTNFVNTYKLYSSDLMVAGSNFSAGTTNEPAEIPADWASRPHEFVDLNSPVTNSAGLNFPILDPRAKDTVTPANSVVGFDYNDSRGATATSLPMPVRWMYQLKDGTLSTMDDSGKVDGADKENPIVGRLAFWTDDDTCKININTAGEGVFWDVPRIYNNQGPAGQADETKMGLFQPAQREYQRYPGHAATISLSSVFPSLTRTQIYALTPRVQDDAAGSDGGTKAPAAPLPLKKERLYSSLDELLFAHSAATPRSTPPPAGVVTPELISRLQFFLTAYNRAPEINLFGKPRVSMWPVNANPALRTGIDKWFAICSTVGGYPFFFQRSSPISPLNDYDNIQRNQNLFSYLQDLTGEVPPGFTGSFLSKFGGPDLNQTLTQIFDYIRCVNLIDTSDKSPSSTVRVFAMTNPVRPSELIRPGNAFLGHHGLGQVAPIQIGNSQGFGRFPTISEATLVFHPMSYWRGLSPAVNPNLVAQYDGPMREGETPGANGTRPATPLPLNARMYRAFLLLEPFSPAQGYVQMNQDYIVRVRGLDGVRVNGQPIGFPLSGESRVQGNSYGMIAGASFPSNAMMQTNFDGITTTVRPLDGGAGRARWPFISDPFPLPAGTFSGDPLQQDAPPNFSVTGTTITVEILNTSGELIQTLEIPLASMGQAPTPSDPPANTMAQGQSGVEVHRGFQDRISWVRQDANPPGPPAPPVNPARPILATDTALSVEPTGIYSDLRVMAATREVPPTAFAPHQKITNNSLTVSNNKATSLRQGLMSPFISGDVFGNLVEGVSTAVRADIASSINGVVNQSGDPGDWDMGVGNSRDGPYINKPDEGDFRESGLPYFSMGGSENSARLGFDTYFAPNRQVPSPGMLGSLPSRVKSGGPWETLLFNPNPAAADNHRGFISPPDYLLLDLFNMPVVEPYAISEPLSTAGKVNMNYQMVPFTYINRDTPLRALFASARVGAVHDGFAATYKNDIHRLKSIRHRINASETLKQFQARFDNNRIFKSASEICSVDLYPLVTSANVPAGSGVQPTYDAARTNIKNWWGTRRLTGDNLREQPYTVLYQNLTTQSNTYTIHVWAQAIQKSVSSPADEMTANDNISGEFRVAYSIERFIDPNNPDLPDFALPGSPTAMDFYQFRVNNTKQFQP